MMSANHEEKKARALKAQIMARKRRVPILIVDDDPDFLHLVTEHVSRIPGAEIEVAYSCTEAVERLTKHSFKLVICDWSLAAHTGPEVFSLADPLLLSQQELLGKIPVMFMSGSDKVACVQNLSAFRNFEPVTFIIKNLGARMIRIMAENVLEFRNSAPAKRGNFGVSRVYQS